MCRRQHVQHAVSSMRSDGQRVFVGVIRWGWARAPALSAIVHREKASLHQPRGAAAAAGSSGRRAAALQLALHTCMHACMQRCMATATAQSHMHAKTASGLATTTRQSKGSMSAHRSPALKTDSKGVPRAPCRGRGGSSWLPGRSFPWQTPSPHSQSAPRPSAALQGGEGRGGQVAGECG